MTVEQALDAMSAARQPSLVPDRASSPSRSPITSGPRHVVQFYKNVDFLAETVATFLATGWKDGAPLIVVAREARLSGISEKLQAKGIDTVDACASGRLDLLGAEKLLSAFMSGSTPDPERFAAELDKVLGRAERTRAVGAALPRVYGEMVDILWKEVSPAAAISLEELWNDLGKQRTFDLMCGYDMNSFKAESDEGRFRSVCSAHTHIVPAEGFSADRDDEEWLREVSRLQQKESALETEVAARRESEENGRRLASIVETSEDAIIAKDLQGRIIEWNRSAERVFGYRRDEVIGRSIEILMPPDAPDDWRKVLKRVTDGERLEHFETRRRTRDGRILDVSLTVSPLRDEDGRIVGAAKIARDVTAEKAARREAEKTRELFLGILSHDLRNPLNAIKVSAYTLKHHATEADQKALTRISNSTERMSRMIDQLLDLTKSRLGGGIPIDRKESDLIAVCGALADEFEVLHPGRLRLTVGDELKGRWDADRLTQAVSNLVSNAFKYGAPESPVSMRASRNGEQALIEVTNQGPEIEPTLLAVIFDPFQRGAVEQHRGIRGLGLGLFIAREIVRAHQGDITVRSNSVEGTTFSVEIPCFSAAV